MAKDLEKWVIAQKKFRLSDKQIQMARELGLNPQKFGGLSNYKQEPWKEPLPQFIENIYFKHFKRESPETVKSLKQIMADAVKKKQLKKIKKAEKRAQLPAQPLFQEQAIESNEEMNPWDGPDPF